MKRNMRNFMGNEKGAVSVYLIIITLFFFLFNAVLIDYARILVAEKQTEHAIQAGLRSVLSSYDGTAQKYGLYVFDGDAEDIFSTVVMENLMMEESDYFRFVDTHLEDGMSLEFDPTRSLVNVDILRHHILEDMKYRAPIEFGVAIVNEFLSVSKAMKETSAFVDIAEAIEDDFEAREKALDDLIKYLSAALKALQDIESRVTGNSQSSFPTIDNLDNILEHYPIYLEKLDEIEDLKERIADLESEINGRDEEDEDLGDLKAQLRELKNRLSHLENQVNTYRQQVSQYGADIDSFLSAYHEALVAARNALGEALVRNENIKRIIKEKREAANDDYNDAVDVSEGNPHSEATDGVEQYLEDLRKKIDDYVIEAAFFSRISELLDAADDTHNHMQEINPEIVSIATQSGRNRFSDLEKKRSAFVLIYDKAVDILEEALHGASQRPDYPVEEGHENDKEEAGGFLKEIKEMLKEIDKLIDEIREDQSEYNALKGILDIYQGEFDDIQKDLALKGPTKAAKEAMGFMNVLFKLLGDLAKNTRDEIYINEYIMTHFESAVPSGLTNREDYYFKNREVEYILYGQHIAGANYGAALSQLFATRFALNLIDAFSDGKVRAAGHPLAVFIAAVLVALEKTISDLKELGRGLEVPLLIKLRGKVELGYHHYLRLFMFLNPGKDNRMLRTLAVIHHTEGIDFRERPTYVTVEVETSVQLWFIPEIAQMLGRTGVLNGKVKDGRYIITRELSASY